MFKSFLVICSIISLLQLMCVDKIVIASMQKADTVARQNIYRVPEETDFKLHFPSQDNADLLPTPDQQRARLTQHFRNRGTSVGPLMTVCLGKSTIYNKPRVRDWLGHKIYEYQSPDDGSLSLSEAQKRSRPLWLDLRLQLFLKANSEECHSPQMKTWRSYLECALRRNQRMEYMIPKYPLHQIGYYHNWFVRVNETAYQSYQTYKPKENWWIYWDHP